MNEYALLVGDQDDTLLVALAAALQRADLRVLHVLPHELNDRQVTIRDEEFWVEQHRIGTLFFRSPPDVRFSGSFVPQDQHFANTEARAVWLAALHLTTLQVVNRYDVATWFGSNRWWTLRQSLIQHHVPVAPLIIGNQPVADPAYWLLYQSNHLYMAPPTAVQRLLGTALTTEQERDRHLVVCGEPLTNAPAPVLQAKDVLATHNIDLVELTTAANGTIVRINTLPAISNEHLEKTVELLLERTYANLHLW